MTDVEFFKIVDDSNVIEDNIQRIVSLEMAESSKFQKIYKEALKSLSMRLQTVNTEGSFTEERLRILRKLLEDTFRHIERNNINQMKGSTRRILRQSGDDTNEEINTLEERFIGIRQRIPWRAIKVSLDKNNFLINNFAASIEAYDADVRAQMERNMSESLLKRNSYRQARLDLSLELGKIQDWKLARVTRTELHGIYNKAKILAMEGTKKTYIPNLKKTLIHPMDGRTAEDSKALKEQNPIIDIQEPFRFKWDDEERVFMAPPDRPNDRAILVPVNPDWLERGSK